VTAERSRPVVVPRTDLPEEPGVERTYREEEVAAILHRAAQLERDQGVAEGALNLREIEAIARDSGIDLSLVRQAARELDDDDAPGIAAAIAGAPLRRTIERVVDVEIGADLHERLAQEIRDVLSWSGVGSRWMLPGSVSSIGRSLTLTGFTGTSAIEVNVAPRDGKTLIRISADRSQLAGGLFGGIVGGVGGGWWCSGRTCSLAPSSRRTPAAWTGAWTRWPIGCRPSPGAPPGRGRYPPALAERLPGSPSGPAVEKSTEGSTGGPVAGRRTRASLPDG